MYDTATTAVMLGVIAALYILPTILAFGRDHAHRQALALVNILFGWTLIGWIGVFLWALLAPAGSGDA
jgi:Na+/proline symporter